MIKLPGISITLGMTQGDHKPFARISGRSGMFTAAKKINLNTQGGLLAAVGAVLVANAVKKAKTQKKGKAAAAKPTTDLFPLR